MTTTRTATTDGTRRRLTTACALMLIATLGLAVVSRAVPARADSGSATAVERQSVMVPEPATLAYVAVTALTLFRRRRARPSGQGRM